MTTDHHDDTEFAQFLQGSGPLSDQLKTMQQPESPAALDATILGNIEALLANETQEKDAQKISAANDTVGPAGANAVRPRFNALWNVPLGLAAGVFLTVLAQMFWKTEQASNQSVALLEKKSHVPMSAAAPAPAISNDQVVMADLDKSKNRTQDKKESAVDAVRSEEKVPTVVSAVVSANSGKLAGASASTPAPSSSSSYSSRSPKAQLETIVVTANKRVEKLESVPMAISVVNEAHIQRNNIREMEDVVALTPALSMKPGKKWSQTAPMKSYPIVRFQIESGNLPSPDAVRIEQMVNHFSYDIPAPSDDAPLDVSTELFPTPWNPATLLLRVSLRAGKPAAPALAGSTATSNTSSAVKLKDVQVHLVFAPGSVAQYRQIGFANHLVQANASGNDDRIDVGNIAADQSYTLLYEITLAKNTNQSRTEWTAKVHALNDELGFLQLSYLPVETMIAEPIKVPLKRSTIRTLPSVDSNFAAAVAAFSMRLAEDTQLPGKFDFAQIRALAETARGKDTSGDRNEFINLVEQAEGVALIKRQLQK